MSSRVRAAPLALLSAVVLSLVVAATPVAALADGGPAAQQTTVDESAPSTETVFLIRLQSDGDARWTISNQYDVSTDERRAAFQDLVERFQDGRSGTASLDTFRRAVALAENNTGREMNLTGVERTADADTGRLNASFTWTNFARGDGDVQVVDDVFNVSGNTWFGGLTEEQVLVVELPPNYGVRSAPRPVQDGRMRWEGPTTFEPGEIRISYSGNARPGTTTTVDPWTPTPGTTTDPATTTPNEDDGLLLGGFFALGLGIVVVGTYVLARRRGGFASGVPADDGPNAPPDDTPDAAPDQAAAAETESDDEIDEELLSDEECVERLLESNGGRMKQANIVTETGWSNAKVSQLLSAMEDDGRIDKLRIGRENLISFPDEDVTEFDEE